MTKKYVRTSNTQMTKDGKILRQICAVKDIPGIVRSGELGGWLTDDSDLSHEGACWVDEGVVVDGSIVRGDIFISGKVLLFNSDITCDGFIVSDKRQCTIANTVLKRMVYIYDGKVFRSFVDGTILFNSTLKDGVFDESIFFSTDMREKTIKREAWTNNKKKTL